MTTPPMQKMTDVELADLEDVLREAPEWSVLRQSGLRSLAELRAYRQPAGEDVERATIFFNTNAKVGLRQEAIIENLASLLSAVRQQAIAGERERCAKLFDDQADEQEAFAANEAQTKSMQLVALSNARKYREIAAAIRSGKGE